MNPYFSVIVPTYNRARLIGETLDTILGQEDPSFELIVVDDGSTDDTEAVVRGYPDSRIRYIRQANAERGAARNHGLRLARGTYAFFFDSDDWMHPDHLSTLRRAIGAEAVPPDFLAAKYQLKDDAGRIRTGGSAPLPPGKYDWEVLAEGNPFATLVAVRTANPNLRFFEEDRSYATLEDWMFLLDNLRDQQLLLVDEVTITVRDHDERSMADNLRVIRARRRATDWALERLKPGDNLRRRLLAHTAYFCGIHYYLEGKRTAAISHAFSAMRLQGPRIKFLMLAAKAAVGKKWINRIK